MVDQEIGVIRSISELPRQAYSPPFFYYKANVSNTITFNGNDNLGTTAGTSLNRNKAIAKALGEGIERYCAGSYSIDEFIHESYNTLNQYALHPDIFQLYTEHQFISKHFPLEKFTTETKTHWVRAKRGSSQEEILVPADFVYCPFLPSKQGSNIAESISTGLAAHCSYEEAAINGFLEVIERNNFIFTWLTKTKPVALKRSTLTQEHEKIIQLYERYGYDVHLSYNVGKDGIPSFIALIRGTRKYNIPLLIAAATHLDPEIAITKCLEEIALMERLCQRKILAPSNLATLAEYNKVTTLLDHIMLWFNPKLWPHANFLCTKDEEISLKDITNHFQAKPKEDLKFIIDTIESIGYKTLIADITPEDIKQLGLHTVRCLVPSYLPLNKSYHCRPLGAKYLVDYFNSKNISSKDHVNFINPVPHPFA